MFGLLYGSIYSKFHEIVVFPGGYENTGDLTAVLIIVIVLIGGRYLIELMKWVIKTSDLKNNSDRNVSV